ncbi:MAG: hypothetical protein ABSB42_03300 [Tepidisphaeraceae bacterium]
MTNSSLNSTAIRMVPKHPPRHRRLLVAAFLITGAAMVFVPARRADAFLFDIVLDPANLVEHVLQVVDLGEQIDAVVQEVENQVKELEHLNLNAVPNIAGIVSGVEGQLESSLYSTPNPASQLDTRYPADMSNATWAQYQSDESTWTDNQRQALVENRQLQNQVYQDMDTTTQQVQDIVDASNSASGETSAIQAHNDLLAVVSGEMAKLQSLKLARSRLKTEKLAQQQSELSYAEAERQRVRSGWDNPAPPTETVADPFQN